VYRRGDLSKTPVEVARERPLLVHDGDQVQFIEDGVKYLVQFPEKRASNGGQAPATAAPAINDQMNPEKDVYVPVSELEVRGETSMNGTEFFSKPQKNKEPSPQPQPPPEKPEPAAAPLLVVTAAGSERESLKKTKITAAEALQCLTKSVKNNIPKPAQLAPLPNTGMSGVIEEDSTKKKKKDGDEVDEKTNRLDEMIAHVQSLRNTLLRHKKLQSSLKEVCTVANDVEDQVLSSPALSNSLSLKNSILLDCQGS
jgi:hypothetical protein